MARYKKLPVIDVTCKCGKGFETNQTKLDAGRGKFCSKKCSYKYKTRPSGLKYTKHKENPTSFKKGHKTWNTGIKTGLTPWNKGIKGTHLSLGTEFKKGDNTNEDNHNWKGDDAGYVPKHDWIKRRHGKADKCEKCHTKEKKKFHWHNISGEYSRDKSDWIMLCPSCHLSIHGEVTRIKNTLKKTTV